MTVTDIEVHQGGLVELAASLPEIVAAQKEHMATCEALLDSNDYQAISGKTFKKKSAWRKLATAYNVTTTVVSHEYWYDEPGHIRRAEFLVRATAPNGRSAEGIGLCDVLERNFGLKQDHDVPATAMTRATNRACSDLFGLGEVSAEEAEGGTPFDTAPRPAPIRHPSAANLERVGTSGPTDAQLRFMGKLIDDQGLSSSDVLADASKVAGRPIASEGDLSVGEASRLIDLWKGGDE